MVTIPSALISLLTRLLWILSMGVHTMTAPFPPHPSGSFSFPLGKWSQFVAQAILQL